MGQVAPWFREQMKRLAGLKFAPPDLTTHWEALHDLTPDELAAAVSQAQRQCDEFPSPRLLRSLARQPWSWRCPHVEHCSNRWQCRDMTVLGRPERQAS